jgi:hypothetical protein
MTNSKPCVGPWECDQILEWLSCKGCEVRTPNPYFPKPEDKPKDE